MKKAQLPTNEAQRLQALMSYGCIDLNTTEAVSHDPQIQQLVDLAQKICHTPIAIVSLVTEKEQVFYAKTGLAEQRTSRDIAFCAHAILQPDLFIIENALLDERFHDNPLVRGEFGLRFYAGMPLKNPDGHHLGTLCVIDRRPRTLDELQCKTLRVLAAQVVNLLELKKQQQQFTHQKELLSNILDYLPVIVFCKEVHNNYAWNIWNKKAEEIFGLKAADCIGKSDFDYFPQEQAAFFRSKDIEAVERGVTVDVPEEQAKTPNGDIILHTKKVVLKNSQGEPTHLLGIAENITELKKAEQTIREQEIKMITSAKLSSLGEMASSIAHEINNPLAVIQGRNAQVIKYLEQLSISDEQKKALINATKIEATTQKIVKIVKGLRNLSRNNFNDQMDIVILGQTIDDTLELCGEKFNQHLITIHKNIPAALAAKGHSAQLSQIFMNLINNAFDALVEQQHLSDKWIRIDYEYQLLAKQEWHLLHFTDAGLGISDDVVKNMMNPFFTTKEVGKGTGLGLSISKSIAQQHGGDLYYNVDGHGNNGHTRFTLKLPVYHTQMLKNVS